ncbi:carbamoyl-phosphate synthase large subunit [Peptococcus simiae]|uniref:carbamoyl-phosphate synthase large subunit n=1 Tax=Peptococcus simiae TaxID=1643805 RepID=UPI00398098DB
MPLNPDLKKVLVIGSGPIVIGQAAEFDYAGTQACRALKEDGLEIVLINSNPATIMTDEAMADHIYIEPLTLETVKRVIEKEQPDAVLSTLGGQTGLTLSMQLAKEGFLDKMGVRLLGANPETIDKAEDRQIFKDTMTAIGQPTIASKVVTHLEDALAYADQIGYPVIVRPAFTLGGSGGGIADDHQALAEIAQHGIDLSPINQILVEKCISGWKEIEFEVIRDKDGNAITVCSMENVDPVGVHTGDSVVIAPAITLADREFQMLRTAALDIVNALEVEGGCNVQFALHPESYDYAVIEVNPRVSRSSALASKATGYPIAKIATKIAIGYRLDEIQNAVTGCTTAASEPTVDYVAVKFPKWPFDKFVYAKRDLGTQMKATGEVMSIGKSFEEALMKAVRGAEIRHDTLADADMQALSDEDLRQEIGKATDLRLFACYEGLRRGMTVDEIHAITMIDEWFLNGFRRLAEYEQAITGKALSEEDYITGKKMGFTDKTLRALSGQDLPMTLKPVYHMVDTCAGEYQAETPYFYSAFYTPEEGAMNEAEDHVKASKKDRVVVFGSGPIRIGQGIEFDYSSVHSVWALKNLGYEVIIINNNPETVSTDFDTADRLYFEPVTWEDVKPILDLEQPIGVVVAYGGQTAIKLTADLAKAGIPIIGTTADGIDMAEDRERFDNLLTELDIKRPAGHTVFTEEEALKAASDIGYPVLMRPSYVLGGQNMIIAWSDADIREYMKVIINAGEAENPILIDKYLSGIEVEVDAITDGQDVLIPGILEHVERTGVHSGDSIAVYPAPNIRPKVAMQILDQTRALCRGLGVIGLANIQYIVYGNDVYVIEVNPRASRTVPYISKVTGVPMIDLATRVSLGEKLQDLGYGTGIYPASTHIAVKIPVFSFEKLIDVDTHLGPEMKSTGEVLGIGKTMLEALYKGLIGAGYTLTKEGGVFISVRDSDKNEIAPIAKKFFNQGFRIYATSGTAKVLRSVGIDLTEVDKMHEGTDENAWGLLESHEVDYIISTSTRGRDPERDSVIMRRKAVSLGIPTLTSLDTANALIDSIAGDFTEENTSLVDIKAL